MMPPSASASSTAMAPSRSTNQRVSGKRRLGHFQLLRKIGQGSMGAVYLAQDTQHGRKVALKVLPPDLARDREYLERFRREARAAIKLDSPHIVRAYELGTAGDYHYISMEYVNGTDLEEGFKKQPKGRYAPAEVLSIAHDMAKALQVAEQERIVHRDIKPANILKSGEGAYKLIDLGLTARSRNEKPVTQTGLAVGTPFYISPEQAQGRDDVDVRSDIYSLGATLYHLATGQLPFNDENPVVVMTRHVREEPKRPQELVPELPKPLSRLIEKMMAKRLRDRPQTATEVLQDVARIRHGKVPLLKRARAKAKPENVPASALKQRHAAVRSRLARPARNDAPASLWSPGRERRRPTAKHREISKAWQYALWTGWVVLSAAIVGLMIVGLSVSL